MEGYIEFIICPSPAQSDIEINKQNNVLLSSSVGALFLRAKRKTVRRIAPIRSASVYIPAVKILSRG